MTDDKETFGMLVTIEATSGPTSIYGERDLKKIVEAGCRELNYVCEFSEVNIPAKFGEHSILLGVYIEPGRSDDE